MRSLSYRGWRASPGGGGVAGFVVAVLVLLAGTERECAAEPVRRVQFKEIDTLFANPGQGWMTNDRKGAREPRFPCSVVYIRFGWAEAEPEQGKINGALIDDVIAAWKHRRASVSLRVMATSAHSRGYYTSPKWLFDLGAKGFEYTVGGDDPTSGGVRIPRIEPDYTDPIFLREHARFIAELGKRYDGHPAVEFLDIGSYGQWGEWHTKHPAPVEVRKKIVDMYLSAFKKTPLVFMSDDAEVLKYALSKGTGFRRDGVGSPWHEKTWIGSKKYADVEGMADTWKKSPIVFEWFGNYEYLQSKKWSFDSAVEFMLKNHVTLINDNIGKVPHEAMPQLEKLARRAGYRFVLREVSHESATQSGGTLTVKMKWSNVGVGKLYRPYVLRMMLIDSAGKTVATQDAKGSPTQWLPGDHDATAAIPLAAGTRAGVYRIAVSLVDPEGQRPWIRLAIDATENDGVYKVSEVEVK